MAECQDGNSIVIWDGIPGGSSLELWTEGSCEDFASTAVATVVGPDGSQSREDWCEHAELCEEAVDGEECGTRACRQLLEAGSSYDVRFRVATNRATQLVKRARICLPDGTLHKRWRCTLNAPAGDVTECRIQILMADAGT